MQYTREQRVRMALTDLGPTFIKLGQILLNPDLVGPSLSEEFKQLRFKVEPDEIGQVRETCVQTQEDYETHFQMIDFEPLATAYRAGSPKPFAMMARGLY